MINNLKHYLDLYHDGSLYQPDKITELDKVVLQFREFCHSFDSCYEKYPMESEKLKQFLLIDCAIILFSF